MKANKWWQSFLPELLITCLILSIFLICADLYQYLTTEYWWLQDQINYSHNTIFLLVLMATLSFLPIKKWLAKWPKLGFLIISLFLITLTAHYKYIFFYEELQQYPKIKGVSKTWGIPGSWVRVTGKNFGEEWKPGKVYLGETEMVLKKWGSKEITFEIPVNVKQENQSLQILNTHNKKQKEYFEFYIEPNLTKN